MLQLHSGLKGTAKKVFEVVATEVVHKCLLAVGGMYLVVSYAREMGLYHDMMRETKKKGYTIEVMMKLGTAIVVTPKCSVAESALANVKALASEFGLAPVSRGRFFTRFYQYVIHPVDKLRSFFCSVIRG